MPKTLQFREYFQARCKTILLQAKDRIVPYAILDDLNQAIDAGIEQGIWKPTQFCEDGTSVVPLCKELLPRQNYMHL